jgi:hypothetical protein
MAVELGDNQIAGLGITVHNQLSNEELGVAALRQLLVATLQLLRNHLALLEVAVLKGSLDNTDRVVLEDEILNAAGDDAEQFLDEFLALLERDVRLAAQLLPQLL